MPARAGRERLRLLSFIGVVVHALFLLGTPFQHHDLICHLKTPQHCTSCTASPAARRSDAPVATGACMMNEAGAPACFEASAESAVVGDRRSGRAPPAQS